MFFKITLIHENDGLLFIRRLLEQFHLGGMVFKAGTYHVLIERETAAMRACIKDGGHYPDNDGCCHKCGARIIP